MSYRIYLLNREYSSQEFMLPIGLVFNLEELEIDQILL